MQSLKEVIKRTIAADCTAFPKSTISYCRMNDVEFTAAVNVGNLRKIFADAGYGQAVIEKLPATDLRVSGEGLRKMRVNVANEIAGHLGIPGDFEEGDFTLTDDKKIGAIEELGGRALDQREFAFA